MTIVTNAILSAAIVYVTAYSIAKLIIALADRLGLVYHPRKD